MSTILEYKDLRLSRSDYDRLIERTTFHYYEDLLDYIKRSGDFPDKKLTNNIRRASQEFRKNFKLRENS